jgi:hypothetical protein
MSGSGSDTVPIGFGFGNGLGLVIGPDISSDLGLWLQLDLVPVIERARARIWSLDRAQS